MSVEDPQESAPADLSGEERVQLSTEEIAKIKNELNIVIAEMFKKENMETDKFFEACKEKNEGIPFDVLIEEPRIVAVTDQRNLVRSAIFDSKNCYLDKDYAVRHWSRPEQNTLILRDFPPDTPKDTIISLFNPSKGTEEVTGQIENKVECAEVQSVRSDMNDTWFVNFSTEAECKEALLKIRNVRYRNKKLSVRLKTASAKPVYTGFGGGASTSSAGNTPYAGQGSGTNIDGSPTFFGRTTPTSGGGISSDVPASKRGTRGGEGGRKNDNSSGRVHTGDAGAGMSGGGMMMYFPPYGVPYGGLPPRGMSPGGPPMLPPGWGGMPMMPMTYPAGGTQGQNGQQLAGGEGVGGGKERAGELDGGEGGEKDQGTGLGNKAREEPTLASSGLSSPEDANKSNVGDAGIRGVEGGTTDVDTGGSGVKGADQILPANPEQAAAVAATAGMMGFTPGAMIPPGGMNHMQMAQYHIQMQMHLAAAQQAAASGGALPMMGGYRMGGNMGGMVPSPYSMHYGTGSIPLGMSMDGGGYGGGDMMGSGSRGLSSGGERAGRKDQGQGGISNRRVARDRDIRDKERDRDRDKDRRDSNDRDGNGRGNRGGGAGDDVGRDRDYRSGPGSGIRQQHGLGQGRNQAGSNGGKGRSAGGGLDDDSRRGRVKGSSNIGSHSESVNGKGGSNMNSNSSGGGSKTGSGNSATTSSSSNGNRKKKAPQEAFNDSDFPAGPSFGGALPGPGQVSNTPARAVVWANMARKSAAANGVSGKAREDGSVSAPASPSSRGKTATTLASQSIDTESAQSSVGKRRAATSTGAEDPPPSTSMSTGAGIDENSVPIRSDSTDLVFGAFDRPIRFPESSSEVGSSLSSSGLSVIKATDISMETVVDELDSGAGKKSSRTSVGVGSSSESIRAATTAATLAANSFSTSESLNEGSGAATNGKAGGRDSAGVSKISVADTSNGTSDVPNHGGSGPTRPKASKSTGSDDIGGTSAGALNPKRSFLDVVRTSPFNGTL